MTREQRDWLRNQIDQAKRARLNDHRAANPNDYCQECGGHKTDPTPACRTCTNRECGKRKRQRNAIPCATGCGAMIAPRDSSKHWYRWTGLCRKCYTAQRAERKAS